MVALLLEPIMFRMFSPPSPPVVCCCGRLLLQLVGGWWGHNPSHIHHDKGQLKGCLRKVPLAIIIIIGAPPLIRLLIYSSSGVTL